MQTVIDLIRFMLEGPAMSWRAVLGGPTEEKPDSMAMRSEDFQADAQAVEAAGPDRGKGWGRGRRDQGIRDERQETGETTPNLLFLPFLHWPCLLMSRSSTAASERYLLSRTPTRSLMLVVKSHNCLSRFPASC